MHTDPPFGITLKLINKNPESVRIVLGMMLPTSGCRGLTHSWIAGFKSTLPQILKEGLDGHPGRHVDAYRIECSVSQRGKLLIVDECNARVFIWPQALRSTLCTCHRHSH